MFVSKIHENFVFKILKMIEKIKTDVLLLRPNLPSLSFPKFWKQIFMYFGRKHVETEPNRSH